MYSLPHYQYPHHSGAFVAINESTLTCHNLSKWYNVFAHNFKDFKYPNVVPDGLAGKDFACNTGDAGSILGWGRSPEGGHDHPLQYSCLENPMDRGAWWVTVHGAAKSWTWLKRHPTQMLSMNLKLSTFTLLLLNRFSHVQLFVMILFMLCFWFFGHKACGILAPRPGIEPGTQIAAHKAPPSLGFSRQEHRSGLPFPSPMHESEMWKWSHSVVSDS